MSRDSALGQFINQNIRSDLNALLDVGWVIVREKNAGKLGGLRGLSGFLCSSFRPSFGRAVCYDLCGQGTISKTPVGKVEVLGHSERSYFELYPIPDIAFFSKITNSVLGVDGGDILVANGRDWFGALPVELQNKLARGFIYEMIWDYARWSFELNVASRKSAELILKKHAIPYGWHGDDLRISWSSCAWRQSWSSNKLEFVNGLMAHLPPCSGIDPAFSEIYTNRNNGIAWADGSGFSFAELSLMIEAYRQVSCRPDLCVGDILLIDNTRCLHGRQASSLAVGSEFICRFGYLSFGRLESVLNV